MAHIHHDELSGEQLAKLNEEIEQELLAYKEQGSPVEEEEEVEISRKRLFFEIPILVLLVLFTLVNAGIFIYQLIDKWL